MLEKHELAAGILAVINGYLGDRGLSLRQEGGIVDATLGEEGAICGELNRGVRRHLPPATGKYGLQVHLLKMLCLPVADDLIRVQHRVNPFTANFFFREQI